MAEKTRVDFRLRQLRTLSLKVILVFLIGIFLIFRFNCMHKYNKVGMYLINDY